MPYSVIRVMILATMPAVLFIRYLYQKRITLETISYGALKQTLMATGMKKPMMSKTYSLARSYSIISIPH